MPHFPRHGSHAVEEGLVALFLQMFAAREINHVSRLADLGFEIKTVVLVGRHHVWDAVADGDAIIGELLNLFRVVGDEPH